MHVLILAFATARHAHQAMGFLRACDVAFQEGAVSGGAGGDFAMLEVQVASASRSRFLTLVAGVNGLLVGERPVAGAADAAAVA